MIYFAKLECEYLFDYDIILYFWRLCLENNNTKDLFKTLTGIWDRANLQQRQQFERELKAFQAHVLQNNPMDSELMSKSHSAELPLPETAPILWKDRVDGRTTNPAKFIRDTYGEWIGRGLTRAMIGRLDTELYEAYARWISPKRHPEDRIFSVDGTIHRVAAKTSEERGLRERRQAAERQARLRARRLQT